MIFAVTRLSRHDILATMTVMKLLFLHRPSIALIAAVLLLLIAFLPPYGVIIGWIFLLSALLICIRQGSFAEIGFRRPASWRRTLAQGFAIGVLAQFVFAIVIDPLLARWTGSPVDLSTLDGMRGNVTAYLIMLAVGWVIGGFLEEMLFRGYLLKRIQYVIGDRAWASAAAVFLTAFAFGMAHGYQDTSGMISTGLMALLLGALFIRSQGNLWLPILVHGMSNTIGLTLIFIDKDKLLSQLIFS